ncbi:hypothetical protein ACFL20_00725 [Spirochaetota bacterium]
MSGNEKLRPLGGSAIKNFLARRMLNRSHIGKNTEIDYELANKRVPPEKGLIVGKSDMHYNDSFVFQGSDDSGNLFMTRLGFRGDGTDVDIWLWFVLDKKKYVIGSDYEKIDDAGLSSISCRGLTYEYAGEGSWRIAYKGSIGSNNEDCEVDMVYRPSTEMYCMSIHTNKDTYALSMAEMKWSREYFKKLRSEGQERIEQGGTVEGKIKVGTKEYSLSLLGFRDHSWGKRDWAMINRYIWNLFALEEPVIINDRSYTHACFTTVNYLTFNHLVSGWIAGKDSVLPIVASTDMELIGGDGKIPAEYTVRFRPHGGPILNANVKRHNHLEHGWFIQDNKYEVNEAYCSIEIDGKKGHGMSEFGYYRG